MAARAITSSPRPIVSIIGTRPEAIKMGPLVRALRSRAGIEQRVLLTGQHRIVADEFLGVALDRLDLDPRDRSVAELRQLIRGAAVDYLERMRPALAIVHGDTTSALAGALAARQCRIPVAHVEAGLRSFNLREPWPEEANRVAIDAVSDMLFAPTATAAANLAAEAVRGAIHVTGNTGIDALLEIARGLPPPSGAAGRKRILVTCHRRENQGARLRGICRALERMASELPLEIVFPLHPNRHVRAAVEAALGGVPRIDLIEPIGHAAMVELMLGSWVILSDSGGLQEEGPALGKPVLVMRDVTERPEALGSVELVGSKPERIVAAVTRLLSDQVRYARMAQPAFPFGDGRAALRIAALIEDWLADGRVAERSGAAL